MPRMPGAIWRGEQSPRLRMDRYDVFCIHTIVGYAPAHAAHFSTTADGDIIQSRDTLYRSAANLNGNHRVIASENEDHGPRFPTWSGSDVPPLTSEQVEANAEIAKWLNGEHGIPLQLCPDSRPTSRGLAYHRQGIDGNYSNGRVSGGEVWSSARGKVCPGDRRIAQLPDILTLAQGDDMPTEQEIKRIVRDETAAAIKDAMPDIAKAVTRQIMQTDLFPKRKIEVTVKDSMREIARELAREELARAKKTT